MNSERYARIKEVFLAACEIPIEQREAWLKETCGADGDLCREVQKLLLHHSEPLVALSTSGSSDSSGTQISVHQVKVVSSASTGPVAARELIQETRSFPPGAMLGTRYRIVCLQGKGGMGEVYRADDLALGQKVALKFLPPAFAEDAGSLARLRNEVRLARRVTHPHVCRVHDLEQYGSDFFISMEYVEGEDLRTLLKRIGRLPYEKAIQLSREIALGLAAIHAKNILHRDLKPANILIDGRGHGRVSDFGLASPVGQVRGAEVRAGTPQYMAPEQLDGREATTKSDIYGLGLLIYELMTGESALRARTLDASRRRREAEPARVPSSLVEQIEPSVERVILGCLEPKPEDRPASALVVAASLGAGADLSLAANVGEELTPELVAAAADLRAGHAGGQGWRLGVFTVLLVAVFLMSWRLHPVVRLGMSRSPERLAADAKNVCRELGLPILPFSTFGFATSAPKAAALGDSGLIKLQHVWLEREAPFFWYRASPARLRPTDAKSLVFGKARVSVDDPPGLSAGSCRILLDVNGQLLSFKSADASGERVPVDAAASKLLRLSGIQAGEVQPVSPQDSTLSEPDRESAWTGTRHGKPIRADEVSREGKPVFFAVQDLGDQKESSVIRGVLRRQWIMTACETVLLAAIACMAFFLAQKNLRRGRSDPRGAMRLSIFIFGLRGASWFLQASHSSRLADEWRMFILMLAGALAESALVWLLYVALEPLARRFWPATEISWSCILRGRFSDTRIGVDILTGCIVGSILALVFYTDLAISSTGWAGSRPAVRAADFFDVLLGLRFVLGFYLDTIRSAIYMALAFMLLIVLLRAWVGHALAAGVIAVLLISPIFMTRGGNEWLSPLLIGGVGVGLCVWTFIRLGLVPIVVAFFVGTVLYRTPMAFSTQVWFEDLSLLALLLVGGLGLVGFLLGRGFSRTVSSSI